MQVLVQYPILPDVESIYNPNVPLLSQPPIVSVANTEVPQAKGEQKRRFVEIGVVMVM